jgi:hypothetical protein
MSSTMKDAFDACYRPRRAEEQRGGSSIGPMLLSSSQQNSSKAVWIQSPAQRIDSLYARRARLLRRIADGDESAHGEYNSVVETLQDIQASEAARVRAEIAREEAEFALSRSASDDAQAFLDRHAHLVSGTDSTAP